MALGFRRFRHRHQPVIRPEPTTWEGPTAENRAAGVDDGDRRNARLYLTGLAASLLGDSAMSLVAGVWVKSLTGSSAQAGLVSACVYAPSLAGPLAGMVVDGRLWVGVTPAELADQAVQVSDRSSERDNLSG